RRLGLLGVLDLLVRAAGVLREVSAALPGVLLARLPGGVRHLDARLGVRGGLGAAAVIGIGTHCRPTYPPCRVHRPGPGPAPCGMGESGRTDGHPVTSVRPYPEPPPGRRTCVAAAERGGQG